MARYIDAGALNLHGTIDEVLWEIYHAPAADVRENVRGEWIDFSMSIKGVPVEACGVCGMWSLGMDKNYCPYCGAKMKGGDAEHAKSLS